MQAAIDALARLHDQLAAALTAQDAEEVRDLVGRRQDLLAALQAAWQGTPETERRRHLATLQALHDEETTLLQRCRSLRDEIGRTLANRSPQRHAPAAHDGASLLDCQA